MIKHFCKRFRYHQLKDQEIVFNFNDSGELFYIILSGEVEVRIPEPMQLVGDQADPDGILSFVLHNHIDINWGNYTGGLRMRDQFYRELRDIGVIMYGDTYFDRKEAFNLLEIAINKGVSSMHYDLYRVFNP